MVNKWLKLLMLLHYRLFLNKNIKHVNMGLKCNYGINNPFERQ